MGYLLIKFKIELRIERLRKFLDCSRYHFPKFLDLRYNLVILAYCSLLIVFFSREQCKAVERFQRFGFALIFKADANGFFVVNVHTFHNLEVRS